MWNILENLRKLLSILLSLFFLLEIQSKTVNKKSKTETFICKLERNSTWKKYWLFDKKYLTLKKYINLKPEFTKRQRDTPSSSHVNRVLEATETGNWGLKQSAGKKVESWKYKPTAKNHFSLSNTSRYIAYGNYKKFYIYSFFFTFLIFISSLQCEPSGFKSF